MINIREIRSTDVDTLIELNKLCIPSMAEENVVWSRSQLLNHIQVFPQGQLLAEDEDGKILGAIASLAAMG